MIDDWGKCEGQVADNRYPLQRFLGQTGHSAVFLTEHGNPQPQKAAIKFISADFPGAEHRLSLWSRVAQLDHANLLHPLHMGRCRLAGRDLLYLVMEYAEENLAQVLPERGLTADETREMLNPLLDVLVYLHGKGLAHMHIKPSNILATADRLKLSSDTISPIGESCEIERQPDRYDAPESGKTPAAASKDSWSLGVTLVEVLTQHAPDLPVAAAADPTTPETLPQPFLDIARHTVRRDPKSRWTSGEIAARLNPVAVAAAAATLSGATVTPKVSPLSVPLSHEPAVPLAKMAIPKSELRRPQTTNRPRESSTLPSFIVPLLLVGVLVVIAIFALPKLFRYHPEPLSTTSSASSPAAATARPADPQPAVPEEKRTSSKPIAAEPPGQGLDKSPAENPTHAASAPATAALAAETSPTSNAARSAGASARHGEVLDEVLPTVSGKALATIHGIIRVTVRVEVDPAGFVSETALDTAGPSSYFAGLAQEAARSWEFSSPESGGHSLSSEWLIRFQFSPSGVKAFPTQIKP
jgi:serine/threonine protein kinase